MTRDIIKAVAKQRNITYKEIADKMGISVTALQISLSRNMTVKTMERIAEAIGISPAEFYKQESASCHCPHCGKRISISVNISASTSDAGEI
jgi:transcriptional regulator with XRE-family HTH domain